MDALKYAARRQQMVMPDINLPTTADSTLDILQLDPVSIMYIQSFGMRDAGPRLNVQDDGNCLFNAVSVLLSGCEELSTELNFGSYS
jgi:hypothetical protein